MKQSNKPKFKKYSFAENTEQSNIEDVPDSQTVENEAQGYIGYEHGYTSYNMRPITEGGKPPRGQQLNQLLNDITKVTQYSTVGGTYGIDEEVLNNTGYPKNAIICVDDVGLFRSLRDDNKESNYNDTSSWKKVVDFNPKFYQQRILGEVFFANRLDNPDGCLKCDGKEYRISYYPRLQKYMENGRVGYTSYSDYTSMVGSTGSCILFAWDKKDKFKAPTLKCGTMLSNPYGQIDAYNNGGSIIPKIGESLYDQVLNAEGYLVFDYHYKEDPFVPGYFGGMIHFDQTTGVFYLTGNKEGIGFFRAGDSIGRYYKYNTLNFKLSNSCRTGSQVLPRTVYLNAFVVVNDYFTTTLDFRRDDSNDPITPGDGVWELVEQYDFTDKNELEFTYDNNERYKLCLSNLRTDATNQSTRLIANVSANGSTYINENNYNMKQVKYGYDTSNYSVTQYNYPYISINYISGDPNSNIYNYSVANLEIDIMKGFNNNKKQFITNLYVSNNNNRQTIQAKIETIATVVSDSFGNAGKIKIKAETTSARLSGNVSFYKIN